MCKITREQCRKTCRTLLTNLSDKHPFLISEILSVLKYNLDEVGTVGILEIFSFHIYRNYLNILYYNIYIV